MMPPDVVDTQLQLYEEKKKIMTTVFEGDSDASTPPWLLGMGEHDVLG